MLLQCLFAFGAIITFSVIIEAPRKCLLVNGILGLAGWAIYLYTEQFTSVLMATFMSTCACNNLPHTGKTFKDTGYNNTYTGDINNSSWSWNVPDGILPVHIRYTAGIIKSCWNNWCGRAIAIAIFIVDALVAVVKRIVL